MSSKKELRTELKKLRTLMDKQEKYVKDRLIAESFLSSSEYTDCSALLVYVSVGIEVDTSAIISDALQKGKPVYCPRCVRGTNDMDFYLIRSLDNLVPGYYDIPEPKAECPKGSFDCKALCIVPALAYDGDGYRLGFGRGFYDKYLTSFPGRTVGLCYESCIRDSVFRESHDIAVDTIITENRKLLINKREDDRPDE